MHHFSVIYPWRQGVYNSQGAVMLQLGVDVLHFALGLLHDPPFFCFRQEEGFHPLCLLHLQQHHEQLQGRTGVSGCLRR